MEVPRGGQGTTPQPEAGSLLAPFVDTFFSGEDQRKNGLHNVLIQINVYYARHFDAITYY